MAQRAQQREQQDAPLKRRHTVIRDLLAGLSVALVLIPQSLAYAELAGLPAHLGLYAAALPPIAAALFASSPFLQTGPTALMSILTLGILSASFTPGSPELVAAAGFLALLVGLIRVGLGLLKLGGVAYFLSQPVLKGFTTAAAVLILASQVPTAFGVTAPGTDILGAFWWTLTHVNLWRPTAALLTVLTLLFILGGRRLSPLFPGVLVAVMVGLAVSYGAGYEGAVIGVIPSALPAFSLAFPWEALSSLFLGAVVIAVVGFAEPAAIARTYAAKQRSGWDPDRELLGQGVANLVAGLFGGFPVGGSFSRSALNYLAGARTRLSGLVTGAAVLAFLPAAPLLSALPRAVLGAIVIGAVWSLLDLRGLARLWRYARLQAVTAYATFGLTLLLAPRIDYGVLLGIGLAVAAHLYRETRLGIVVRRSDDVLSVELAGVLWFGSTRRLETVLRPLLTTPRATHLVIDAHGLGRLDLSGAMLLADLLSEAEARGLSAHVEGLEPHMQRVLERVQKTPSPTGR